MENFQQIQQFKKEINDEKILIGKVKSETLFNILRKNDFPFQFEFLSIDVEGVDFEFLKGLNLQIYHPEIICIENWSVTSGIKNVFESETHQFLATHNYKLIAFTGLSTIYKI